MAFPNSLKERLSEKEYSALTLALKQGADNTVSSYGVCLAVRQDVKKARETVDALRSNISDCTSLQEYVAGVKTLYLADRNARQTTECAYDVQGDDALLQTALLTATANAHLLISSLTKKDMLALCKAKKCFDDLKFFASVLKADKTVYESLSSQSEKAILSLTPSPSQKLIPTYLSLISLEDAEKIAEEFDGIFSAVKQTRNNTDEIVFWSAKGLDVYGFCEQANALRAWATDRFLDGDKRFSSATITEIIINN